MTFIQAIMRMKPEFQSISCLEIEYQSTFRFKELTQESSKKIGE